MRYPLIGSGQRLNPVWYPVLVVMLIAIVLGGTLIVRNQTSRAASAGVTVAFDGPTPLSAQISYDGSGIPTVTASSYTAAMAGLGYVEASQRLYEMEQFLWTANGTLSSYLGAGQGQANLSSDLLFTVLDLPVQAQQAYAHADSNTKTLLAAYSQGVNTYVAHNPLPKEFTALGITKLPAWTGTDSLLIAMYFNAGLDLPTWLTKLTYAGLAGVSPELAQTLIPAQPNSPSMFDAQGNLNTPATFLASNAYSGAPLSSAVTATTAQASQSQPQTLASLLKALPGKLTTLGAQLTKVSQLPSLATVAAGPESNNWVVAGSVNGKQITASGKPLLANDPHLSFATPSVTYLVNIVLLDMTISGYTCPGLPVMLGAQIEHSDGTSVAYGVTYGLADVDDIYAEQIRDVPTSTCASGKQAFIDGAWQCMSVRQVSVTVAHGDAIPLTIYGDSHGQIINPAFGGALDAFGQLALKMTSDNPAWSIDGYFTLPMATDQASMESGIDKVSVSFNFVYVIGQHIGYKLSGQVPQRNAANTVSIVPGNDPAYDWQGFAPASALPGKYNPPSGFITTANNRLVPTNYAPGGTPVYISNQFDDAFRAQTITAQLQAWITSGHKITVSDMATLQLNTVSGAAAVTVPVLLSIANRVGTKNAAEQSDLAALSSWDNNVTTDSRAAAVYEAWMATLDLNLESPNTGPLYQFYASSVWILQQQQAAYQQLVSPTLMTPAERDTWVMTSLTQAEQLLKDANATTWGDLHRLAYNHPFAVPGTWYYDASYQIGPATGYARPGDPSTVNSGGWDTNIGILALPASQLTAAGGAQAAFAQQAGPSSRVIFTPGAPASSIAVCATGEDGEPGAHYSDLATDWRNGVYVPLS